MDGKKGYIEASIQMEIFKKKLIIQMERKKGYIEDGIYQDKFGKKLITLMERSTEDVENGILRRPMIPKIKKAAIKLGTTPIRDNLIFLNRIINIVNIPIITNPKVKI